MDDRNVIQATNITEKEYASVDTLQREGPVQKPQKKKSSLFSSDWLKKFKTVKGIKIIIPVILLCVLFVGYLSFNKKNDTTKTTNQTTQYMTASEYSEMIEKKLSSVLSNVKGAGTVSVMVSLDSGPELVYAMSKDSETNTVTTGGNSTTTVTLVEEPIIITQNGQSTPLILMEKMPQVKGVIVVSSGASDIGVKLELIQAVQSLLDVKDKNIQVITGI